jgi:polyketide synthase PksM/rhizoxin synthesis polyketide synthase RhiD
MQRGEAWSRGAGLDIPALYPNGGNRMVLPGYEFEHPLASPTSGTTPPALFSSELYRRISSGELDAAQFERLLTTSTTEQGTL